MICMLNNYVQVQRKYAREVLQDCTDELIEKYNEITAMDIGYREKGGVEQCDGDVCLLVWVKEKLKHLDKDKLLPAEVDGIPVDVRQGKIIPVVNFMHSYSITHEHDCAVCAFVFIHP